MNQNIKNQLVQKQYNLKSTGSNMKLINMFANGTSDCLICALRPTIIFGFSSSFLAKPECQHTYAKIKEPRLRESKLLTAVYLIFNFFILIGLGISVYELFVDDNVHFKNTFKYAVLVVKFLNSTIFSLTLFINQNNCIKFINLLIDIIDKRRLFGIDTILTANITTVFRLVSLLLACSSSIFIVVHLLDSIWRSFTVKNVILSLAFALRTLNYVNYAIIGGMSIILYWLCLDKCYKQIQDILKKEIDELENSNTSSTDFLKKLQYLQKFYLITCRNYKNQFKSFGNVIFYGQEFIYGVFMCVQSYFYYAYIKDNEIVDILTTNYSEMDNFFVLFGFPIFVWLGSTLADWSQNLISFLHKYKTTKLGAQEKLQLEMLLITLETEKPNLMAADLFPLGINLLASVPATTITYVLVALQFKVFCSAT